ncbi:hypothetical protein LCGC14_1908200 [marine sediment metagenome]|uniref:Uncharacterized protein n=1 Tax=marine sediment metagenome TaxID=412755 RepID=A0A0F9GHP8_9ZZZZ
MARYATQEDMITCGHCDTRFARREAKYRRALSIILYSCPCCGESCMYSGSGTNCKGGLSD